MLLIRLKRNEVMNLGKELSGNTDGFPEKGESREVYFSSDVPSDNSKRKRYLTAKYDRRTRQKISEKIRLENFVFEQLRILYRTEVSMKFLMSFVPKVDDYDCDIDLDEISDLKTNDQKVQNLKEKLKSCPAKQEQIDGVSIEILVLSCTGIFQFRAMRKSIFIGDVSIKNIVAL
ncbi:unnamed protein product [Schistosoma turkestanicum]|nr:unnamed protein product [Schistosoma turkestanicum]